MSERTTHFYWCNYLQTPAYVCNCGLYESVQAKSDALVQESFGDYLRRMEAEISERTGRKVRIIVQPEVLRLKPLIEVVTNE